MRTFAILLVLVFTRAILAAAPAAADIPDTVNYEPASAAADQQARERLLAALKEGPETLAKLFGPHDTRTNTTMVGPFLSIYIDSLQLNVSRQFGKFTYTMPPSAFGAKMQVAAFHADNPERRRLVAQLVALIAKSPDSGKVRAPNFDELAMIWAWISWDLSGPLLVYETGDEKLLFDFDKDTGQITWIERLTDPCFSGTQEGKQVMSCQCVKIDRHQSKWQLGLEPKPSCTDPTRESMAGKVAATGIVLENSSADPKFAYIRIGARTARVDELLIVAYDPDRLLMRLPDGMPKYQAVGKLLSGSAPKGPLDEAGQPVHGYVLLASIINADGQLVANLPLLYTDSRLAAAVLASANAVRVEPARRDSRPVAEAIWQQFDF
jgi:hypothetical protein